MTLDEAILHAREKAREKMLEYENHYDKDEHYYPRQCKRCAEEHEQLAEWLEELKAFRENKWTDIYIKRGYDKAIDDFVANVKDALITDYSVFNTDDIRIFIDIIEEIAEQLKAGGENV